MFNRFFTDWLDTQSSYYSIRGERTIMYAIWFKSGQVAIFYDLDDWNDYLDHVIGYELNDITRIERVTYPVR
jgi:hypothetical protein